MYSKYVKKLIIRFGVDFFFFVVDWVFFVFGSVILIIFFFFELFLCLLFFEWDVDRGFVVFLFSMFVVRGLDVLLVWFMFVRFGEFELDFVFVLCCIILKDIFV